MTRSTFGTSLRKATIPSILLVLTLGGLLQAQESPYGEPNSPYAQASPPYAQESPLLSPGQLADLVAPIALYPDPLLGQILVVSTYPQELEDAAQWMQYNGNLQGPQLMEAAQQQNWDPSVQALVAFPNVIAMLTSDMQWTTELGQAFLAQPADVMNAIQYLRAQAQSNGQLRSTPQLAVNSEYQDGQSAIDIEPANPQMMYVPSYNPYSVWGSPEDGGGYPALSYAGSVFGSLFSTATNLAGMFPGFTGLLGPSGWGWALGWLAQTLFVNNGFFSAFGFHNLFGGGGRGFGRSVWVHDDRRGGPAYAWNGGRGRSDWGRSRFNGREGGGWRFGAGRSGYNSQGWDAGGDSPRSNWGTNAGNWRNYAANSRLPAYRPGGQFGRPFAQNSRQWSGAGNRGYQSANRFGANRYAGGAANFRAPSTDWRFGRAGNGGYSNFASRGQSVPRDVRQARWSRGNSSGFAQPRMNSGRSFWSRPFSGSGRAPKQANFKQPHFKEPHFKQPHFKQPHFKQPHFESHGSGHFSHGHSGGKHRR